MDERNLGGSSCAVDLSKLLQADPLAPTPLSLTKDGRAVSIATFLRQEQLWIRQQPPSFKSVPNKPALDFEGSPTWAEFILLRLLERGGWAGVWVKNFGGRSFWSNVLETLDLPFHASDIFQRIEKRAGGHGGGCWDIFAWRDGSYFFIESKQHMKDEKYVRRRKIGSKAHLRKDCRPPPSRWWNGDSSF